MVAKAGSGRLSPVRARTMKEYDQVSLLYLLFPFLILDILYIEVVSLLRAYVSDPKRMVQLHCTRPS